MCVLTNYIQAPPVTSTPLSVQTSGGMVHDEADGVTDEGPEKEFTS